LSGTTFHDLGVFSDRAILLIGVDEQSSQCGIRSEVVTVYFERAPKFAFGSRGISFKAIDLALQKMKAGVVRLVSD
jgi:hypothetical protein